MTEEGNQRRLAAILAADVVGYSAFMAQDDAGMLAALKHYRANTFDPLVAAHNGRIVKLMGDGVLVEFASVVDAVECAIAIQSTDSTQMDERIRLRIGINLGDIIVDGSDIYGDGVNVAARLESLSEIDGICISGIVRDSLGKRIDDRFVDAGEQLLKNIDRPVKVFHWTKHISIDEKEVAKSRQFVTEQKPEKPSIAVLAFDNMSGDVEQEYFSDGIAEDIITALSHFREFFVIARNTTFTYKGQPIRVDELCRELGVRYLLEGSVRKAGGRIRVTAQLVDGETSAHLWAAKYDRDLNDVFAVQDEITQAIVSAVAPETLVAELKRSQLKKPESLSTWEMVLRARWHMNQLTRKDNETAKVWLEKAIDSTLGLSDAHATLALCHLHSMLHFWRKDIVPAISAAIEEARKAVSLDENDANAHAILGMAETFGRNYEDAIHHLERATQLNINLANAYGVLAAVHGVSGEFEKAREMSNKALALSPRDPSKAFWLGGVGIGAYVSRNYDECLAISRKVLKDHPGYASSMRQEVASLAMMGLKEEAEEALKKLLERMPGLTVEQVRQMVPVRYPEDHEHWLEGLRRAGLPE